MMKFHSLQFSIDSRCNIIYEDMDRLQMHFLGFTSYFESIDEQGHNCPVDEDEIFNQWTIVSFHNHVPLLSTANLEAPLCLLTLGRVGVRHGQGCG